MWAVEGSVFEPVKRKGHNKYAQYKVVTEDNTWFTLAVKVVHLFAGCCGVP